VLRQLARPARLRTLRSAIDRPRASGAGRYYLMGAGRTRGTSTSGASGRT
jgi:hypothetical protein